jgi:hypothetical protein
MMGGFRFFRYLQNERSDLLDFRAGDKWQIVHGWLRDRLKDAARIRRPAAPLERVRDRRPETTLTPPHTPGGTDPETIYPLTHQIKRETAQYV